MQQNARHRPYNYDKMLRSPRSVKQSVCWIECRSRPLTGRGWLQSSYLGVSNGQQEPKFKFEKVGNNLFEVPPRPPVHKYLTSEKQRRSTLAVDGAQSAGRGARGSGRGMWDVGRGERAVKVGNFPVCNCSNRTAKSKHLLKFLFIVLPSARILGGPDLHVDMGSTINLTCLIQFSPEPPAYIFWYHEDEVSKPQPQERPACARRGGAPHRRLRRIQGARGDPPINSRRTAARAPFATSCSDE
ncbi:unnamed protein product [Plutella xylostella]|uniref:(diamondback moth) hypothetical protein n=1 Tax=Plutella xylostella TaxID=51655 RepID=A0A8S4FVX7_PLUXY|nr:unnamed protein product [Plutella xylostella]